jgi:sugar phosphate isomerase/epimerase
MTPASITRAFSTHFFRNHRLTIEHLQQVADRAAMVEIFCTRQHFDWRDRTAVLALKTWFRDNKLELRSLHSPMSSDEQGGRGRPQAGVNLAEPEKIRRRDSVDEVKRAIDVSEEIPFRYLTQHLGVVDQEWDMRYVDAIFSSLSELNVFAKHRGVEILLENIPNGLSSAQGLLNILHETRLNNNFVFDTGHAQIEAFARAKRGMPGAFLEAEFELMAPRIRHTHVHDNNGTDDVHLFPFVHPVSTNPAEADKTTGSINWIKTMDLLRRHADQYPLMLELREADGVQIGMVNEVFNRLEQAHEPDPNR